MTSARYQYRIAEKATGGFICCVMIGDSIYGAVHEAPDHESMMAWLRLVVGDYPGMTKRGVA